MVHTKKTYWHYITGIVFYFCNLELKVIGLQELLSVFPRTTVSKLFTAEMLIVN